MTRSPGVLLDGRKSHPNANPVLQIMRESFGDGDDWGTTMMWLFGVCEVLYVAGGKVPAEVGFHPSPFLELADPDEEPDEYPDAEVWHLLYRTPGRWVDPNFGVTLEKLQFAARVLSRYADWLKAAGRSY